MNSEYWITSLHFSLILYLRTLRGSGSEKHDQVLGRFKAKNTLYCYMSLAFDVHNLHATLIERGKNASLVQRGVPKAENEMKSW